MAADDVSDGAALTSTASAPHTMVDGSDYSEWYARVGRFQRKESEFRHTLSVDGSTPFAVESGRYHLYVSHACPWAHRVLIHRRLLGLEDHIGVSVVDWLMQDDGSWVFGTRVPGSTGDLVNGFDSLQQVYRLADPGFRGIGTVPVLFDTVNQTIVNNESREIIRMLNRIMGSVLGNGLMLAPDELLEDIDAMIDANYEPINNGVYKTGFARTQDAYDEAVDALFDQMRVMDALLAGQRWLVGDRLTEADVCLFVTMVRFDAVYHGHFKCSKAKLVEFPHLWGHTRDMYQIPGISGTVDMDHIREHYHRSHTSIDRFRILPAAPLHADFMAPPGRETLPGAAAPDLG